MTTKMWENERGGFGKYMRNLDVVKQMFDRGVIKCRLSKLSISGCKKFKDKAEFDFMFPLTVLVGQNGSGKTTVTRAIRLLNPHYNPVCEFFETEIDNGGFEDARFDYIVDGQKVSYQHLEKSDHWNIEGDLPQGMAVSSIQTKSIVGGIEKSFLYDSITKSAHREDQVEYVQKQAHKLQQEPQEGSGKIRYQLTDDELLAVNSILDSNFTKINVVRHRFFNGTWATNVLFHNENDFCEYNAGSGEFLIATLVREIEKSRNNSIVLIDEPEVSLHPSAQHRLMDYFLDVIKRKKLQMIVTTHSEHIVETLPKEAIICLRKNGDRTYVQQNILPDIAFLEIGSSVQNHKRIIVEDSMAKNIVDCVLKKEGLDQIVSVEFYPGGCSNLKKYTILTYARTGIHDQFIVFDGDQYKADVPDFSSVLERNKTLTYYRNLFQQVVGIQHSTMDWGLDGNRTEGRFNEEQEKRQIEVYLNFYRSNVYFLPKAIPEDIIYDEDYLKIICGAREFPDIGNARDSKDKLFLIANSLDISIENIEQLLIGQFAAKKENEYQMISGLLHRIAGQC